MMEKVWKAVEKMDDEEYKKMCDLEEVFLYYGDIVAGEELTEMCNKYGFSRKAFIDWCCE